MCSKNKATKTMLTVNLSCFCPRPRCHRVSPLGHTAVFPLDLFPSVLLNHRHTGDTVYAVYEIDSHWLVLTQPSVAWAIEQLSSASRGEMRTAIVRWQTDKTRPSVGPGRWTDTWKVSTHLVTQQRELDGNLCDTECQKRRRGLSWTCGTKPSESTQEKGVLNLI